MMYLLNAALATAAVLAAPASALSVQRRDTDPCAGVSGGVATLPGTFQLAALNTTLANANSTGSPLVVGEYANSAGEVSYLLGPWGTSSTGATAQQTTFNLTAGALVTVAPPASAVGEYVVNGNGLFFGRSLPGYPTEAPGPGYCVTTVSGTKRLAVNGRADLFSVCTNEWWPTVYYNATAFWQSWHQLSDCYPVVVNILDGAASSSASATSAQSGSSSAAASATAGGSASSAHAPSTTATSAAAPAGSASASGSAGGSGGGSASALPASTPSGSGSLTITTTTRASSASGSASGSAASASGSASAALGAAPARVLLAGAVGALAWVAGAV